MKYWLICFVVALWMLPGSVHAQSVAGRFVNTEKWTGTFKLTVVYRDSGGGVFADLVARGPATLINKNPKSASGPMVWPSPAYSNAQVPDASNLDPNSPTFMQDMQRIMNESGAIQQGNLQWEATIRYKYLSRMNAFPVDVRDVACEYNGTKKSKLSISIFIDHSSSSKPTTFAISGAIDVDPKNLVCQGTRDGVAIDPTLEASQVDRDLLHFQGEAKRIIARENTNRMSGIKTYKDGNSTITVEYDFVAQ